MTFEKRLAALGVDLSDLPDEHSMEQCASACIEAGKWSKYTDHTVPYEYILHLTDIIDRMETRLVNLTGERDYLLRLIENHWNDELLVNPCEFCRSYSENEKCWRTCDGEEPLEIGVPEDWRADDA